MLIIDVFTYNSASNLKIQKKYTTVIDILDFYS